VTPARARRSPLLPILCLGAATIFAALGVWQVERRAWKLDLIARVEARVHAPATALPPPRTWPALDGTRIEYRHVTTRGRFRHDKETLVDALTDLGPGYWVVTPLRTDAGTLLVNRGFVPTARADPRTRRESQAEGEGEVRVTGLVRLSEPGGRFLRTNAPTQERWYSRDVAAIARARGLGPVAPFFVDADATPNPGNVPRGGLTVVRFRNAHLVYALTWFSLAAMSLAGLVLTRRAVQGKD
jgi:surfeit locus 1 family protein